MTLYERIKALYPTLDDNEFHPFNGTVSLQNDSDGNGDYIAKWEHLTLARPTDEQLAAYNEGLTRRSFSTSLSAALVA